MPRQFFSHLTPLLLPFPIFFLFFFFFSSQIFFFSFIQVATKLFLKFAGVNWFRWLIQFILWLILVNRLCFCCFYDARMLRHNLYNFIFRLSQDKIIYFLISQFFFLLSFFEMYCLIPLKLLLIVLFIFLEMVGELGNVWL